MGPDSVSVIIPAYNAGRTIGRAVDSLLSQTRPPEEILVIDDGSSEQMANCLLAYGDRVRLFRKVNGGAASARNFGIDLARGDLIAFLDADDYWEPHKLELQVDIMKRRPEVGVCASRYYIEHPGEPRTVCPGEIEVQLDAVVRPRGPEAFQFGMVIWTSTVLVRRNVLGNHRFECGLRTAEDRELWIRLVDSCPVYVFSERLATLVAEPNSLSRSNVALDYSNMLTVVDRYRDMLGPDEARRWERRAFRLWAAGQLGSGWPRAAVAPAWQRLWREPLSLEAWWILFKSVTLACAGRRSGSAVVSNAPPVPAPPAGDNSKALTAEGNA